MGDSPCFILRPARRSSRRAAATGPCGTRRSWARRALPPSASSRPAGVQKSGTAARTFATGEAGGEHVLHLHRRVLVRMRSRSSFIHSASGWSGPALARISGRCSAVFPASTDQTPFASFVAAAVDLAGELRQQNGVVQVARDRRRFRGPADRRSRGRRAGSSGTGRSSRSSPRWSCTACRA